MSDFWWGVVIGSGSGFAVMGVIWRLWWLHFERQEIKTMLENDHYSDQNLGLAEYAEPSWWLRWSPWAQ